MIKLQANTFSVVHQNEQGATQVVGVIEFDDLYENWTFKPNHDIVFNKEELLEITGLMV